MSTPSTTASTSRAMNPNIMPTSGCLAGGLSVDVTLNATTLDQVLKKDDTPGDPSHLQALALGKADQKVEGACGDAADGSANKRGLECARHLSSLCAAGPGEGAGERKGSGRGTTRPRLDGEREFVKRCLVDCIGRESMLSPIGPFLRSNVTHGRANDQNDTGRGRTDHESHFVVSYCDREVVMGVAGDDRLIGVLLGDGARHDLRDAVVIGHPPGRLRDAA